MVRQLVLVGMAGREMLGEHLAAACRSRVMKPSVAGAAREMAGELGDHVLPGTIGRTFL